MSLLPLINFGVTLNEVLITQSPVDNRDFLDIQNEGITIPGNVTLFEEHDTRTKIGYTIEQWYNLQPEERAMEIAIKRIRGAIEYQQRKEEERMMKSKK